MTRTPKTSRVRVARRIGQPGAVLTIDHLQFTLTEASIEHLAAQLLTVLEARRTQKPPTTHLDVIGTTGGKATVENDTR